LLRKGDEIGKETAMLVLSRRPDQRIDFPALGISVEVLRVSGKNVRLGIKAPPEIRVVRNEIADSELYGNPPGSNKLSPDVIHSIRNRLNAAVLGLHLLQRQVECDSTENADDTFQKILYELGTIAGEVEQAKQPEENTDELRRRILLVEDDRNESELLAGFLRTYDFEVATARDGSEALDYLAEHPNPDFVLLDMRMPGKDGPDTIEEIRANPLYRQLRVFAVSGTEPRSLGVPMGSHGIDGWFPKPLDPQVLVKELSALETNAV
jgi:carbon storage regulator CsrA